MNIVVLDGYSANPGDLSWDPIERCGTCNIYDRTSPDEVTERVRDAEAILTNKVPVGRSVIEQAPNLRYIGVLATGYNIVDTDAATRKGIVVANVPAYGTDSTAQGALALLLELTNHVGLHNQSVHNGDWSGQPDFCYWHKPIVELSGLTMGIIGFGRIGQTFARLAEVLGMLVIVSTRSAPDHRAYRHVDLDNLLGEADVVSLHCSLTPETAGLIDRRRLEQMKPSSFLINTARGALIVEEDLAQALNAGVISGAGLDVLINEPPQRSNPLLRARNCIITPHNHWASAAARNRLIERSGANLKAFIAGRPVNIVNPLPRHAP